jgi:methionine aminotransferase
VRDAISPRTRMIIINSPHNPTGAVLSQQDMDALAELVRDTLIIVLSDEVYANMLYDTRRHHSAQAHPELRERSISVFSFGKMLHATGWRVGYAIAPPSITRELRKVHQFNTFSIAYPLQWAIAEFLKSCPEHRAGLAAFYQEKRDLFLTLLQNSRFTWTPSPGSFFQLLEYSKISSECDTEFAEHVLGEHGVASIPLSPFCAQPVNYRYLRFCFAKRDETLAKAAELLCKI